jgi:hypothetical protein
MPSLFPKSAPTCLVLKPRLRAAPMMEGLVFTRHTFRWAPIPSGCALLFAKLERAVENGVRFLDSGRRQPFGAQFGQRSATSCCLMAVKLAANFLSDVALATARAFWL